MLIATGVVLLLLSLAARHSGMSGNFAGITSWSGALLVIVGIGKTMFLDD